MDIQITSGGVTAPQGFLASGIHCGIRHNQSKKDLALIYSEAPCAAASVYTLNKVKGAPIYVTQNNLKDGKAQCILCNSGNANTCNADGEEKALAMCAAAAEKLGISSNDVIVASTGVIGQPLPIQPILDGMDALVKELSPQGSDHAAQAIMTTDLVKKEIALSFTLGGKPCKIGGIAKGSGMIHPNMATMLVFVTTDAAITPELLQKALSMDVQDTFNMISVDGDTSTNDMVSVLANGKAGNPLIAQEGEDYTQFCKALRAVTTHLCKSIAADGEGATKMLECTVTGAPDKNTARIVAKSVITSSLFKAAMFGADANWGRVLCAIGYAPADFDIQQVGVTLGSSKGTIQVCGKGTGVPFSEEEAKEILQEDTILIGVQLNQGQETATAWGCDLTYDYVKINGDYRS